MLTSPVQLTIAKIAGLIDPFEGNNAAKIQLGWKIGYFWSRLWIIFQEKIHLNSLKKSPKSPNWVRTVLIKIVDTTNSDMAYQNALLELQVPS